MTNILWWMLIGWWWIPTKWAFCKFHKKPWFWAIIIVVSIISLIGGSKQDKSIDDMSNPIITQEESRSTPLKEPEKIVLETPSEPPITEIKQDDVKPIEENSHPITKSETERDYVLNNNSMKFHYPSCHHSEKIKLENRTDYHGTREKILQMGYEPCGKCNP